MKKYLLTALTTTLIFLLVIMFVVKKPVELLRTSIERQEPTGQINPSKTSHRFLIAPKIESVNCDENGYNLRLKAKCVDLLVSLLESVEPGGAKGEVQFGYTLTIPVYELFTKRDGKWEINKNQISMWMNLIKQVNRPVVVHVASNHFTKKLEIIDEISKDPNNLMAYVGGKNSAGEYFGAPVHLFTLSTKKDLSINQYRFSAIRALSNSLLKLNNERPDLIYGVTLVGETYHLNKDIKNKTGKHFKIEFTDYSELSKETFRSWLKDQYPTLDELNKFASTNFASWNDVEPPYQDFRDKKIHQAWTHFDSFATGKLPIFGWAICADKTKPTINVYLNGKKKGKAMYGLNRLDVYRNVKTVESPNVGYRYRLNYADLNSGNHKLSVKAVCQGNAEIEIGSRNITILTKSEIEKTDISKLPSPKRIISKARKNGVIAFLGFPRMSEKLFFNPYAKLWQDFRGYQVENYLRVSWKAFLENGFPEDKVFCAQMVPDLHGSWNQAQLGTHKSLAKDSPYLPSFMLYGGLAHNTHINSYIRRNVYAVSQFNPLMFKDKQSSIEAIFFHRNNGASFIAPYYMSVDKTAVYNKYSPHSKMLIYPDSPFPESMYLYEAIKKAVKH